MKPPTRAQYPFVGRVGPIGLADKKSFGRPTRRLSQHPMGDHGIEWMSVACGRQA